jgi:hypothetical protein
MSGLAGWTTRRRSPLVWVVLAGGLLTAIVAAGMAVVRPAEELISPPGSALPTGDECAETIERSGWEPVPENTEANHHIPDAVEIPERTDYARAANTEFFPRIDGAFVGTTDEIIEWGACKWGFDPDLVRAQAFVESSWAQDATGDLTDNPEECVTGDAPPCPTSFGLLQIKHLFHPGTFPSSLESTAFNVDYWGAIIRSYYDGRQRWMLQHDSRYRHGDLVGSVGAWFSGRWHDRRAHRYVRRVLRVMRERTWLRERFLWVESGR